MAKIFRRKGYRLYELKVTCLTRTPNDFSQGQLNVSLYMSSYAIFVNFGTPPNYGF